MPVVHADGRAGHAVQRAPSAPRAPPQRSVRHGAGPREHDTVGMCALDLGGRMAAGGSSNGATHKIPGRVSDTFRWSARAATLTATRAAWAPRATAT